VETADVRTLFSAPAHPYTIALLQSLPQFGAGLERLHTIGGQPPDLRNLPPGCSFAPRCSKVMEICRTEYPAQREIGAGHTVCCHLAEQGRSAG
jgi:oligopeptide transport system ATP-binding protein